MTADTLRVRLLGPVDVVVGDSPRPIAGVRRKAVLAVLALRPGQPVSTERLIDLVWGESPPATAVNTLQRHVSHLRDVVGQRSAIAARAPGYLLDLPASATDLGCADQLIDAAREACGPGERAGRLRAALALWRGPSLADVAAVPWLSGQAQRLENLRVDILAGLVEARLELGEHTQVIPELAELVGQHQFREELHRYLILALYRSGRQADALEAYQRIRCLLDAELGIEPGPALRDLETAILRQDPALDLREPTQVASGVSATTKPWPAAALPATATALMSTAAAPASTTDLPLAVQPPPTPAQLPRALPAFVGRDAELRQLDALLPGTDADRSGVAVGVVSGSAGVGKTTLALHWAHRVASRFPDGQLYVNLRGYEPGATPIDPAEALRGLLDAIGVPAAQIPADVDSRANLYRSVIAGKRLLFVIDNARDDEQVRALIPATPGCLALVTSRNQMAGLVAIDGAWPLVLDLPSADDARELMIRRLGQVRVAAESSAVDDIIDRCGRLPLALAVVAARASVQPQLRLATVADELNGIATMLDPLDGGDPASDVRAAFSWSYRTLSSSAARLFRAIGLSPGPDLGLAAIASLVGAPLRQVRPLLGELTRLHLLTEHQPGRYRMHDLLYAYAAEQAHVVDDESLRAQMICQLLDHYLHTAYHCARLISPARDAIQLRPPAQGVTVIHPGDRAEAVAWLSAERPALIAAVDQAAGRFDGHVWQLAWALEYFLDRQGYFLENAQVQKAGLSAALRLNDRAAQAYAYCSLGCAATTMDRLEEAQAHNLNALHLSHELGDPVACARAHLNLGWTADRRGDHTTSLAHGRQALQSYQDGDNRYGQAYALVLISWSLAHLGQLGAATVQCQHSLNLFRDLQDGRGEAAAWDTLGLIHFRLGAPNRAVVCYEHAITRLRQVQDRRGEAFTFLSLADGHDRGENGVAARRARQQALALFELIDDPSAASVRTQLRASRDRTEPRGRDGLGVADLRPLGRAAAVT